MPIVKPFETLEPLEMYVDSLTRLTADPKDETALDDLLIADMRLTEKAVIHPETTFVHDEGWRVVGYSSCTLSDGISELAQYNRGDKAPAEGNEILATHDALRRQSRGALISLGGHLALSGAFYPDQMVEAYQIIRRGLDVMADGDKEFAEFGAKRISRDLLSNLTMLRTNSRYEVPIARSEAKENIDSAWSVMGRPFGILTKAVGVVVPRNDW